MSESAGPPRPDPARRAKEIFLDLLELPREQRAGELDKRAGDDAAMRAAVQSLLDASVRAEGFLAGPTVGQSTAGDTSDSSDVPLRQIGPYKLLQVIGEGGFGTVYMAEQESPVRRRVALKVIKLGMDTKQVVARFEAERQALAMMDHPNIAKVFDAGATENGRPFFVMELVKGDPITQYCDAHRLTPRQRLELFIPVCQAVQHAHQKGIIHRDIKPSNVLVTLHDGKAVPKVIDFGIAKATQARLTEKTVFTEFRQMIGTPEYMSPEQAEMSGLDIDTRSDIYSLGVLLYELLTGTTPFDARELRSKAYAEIQRVIREVDPPKPSTRLSSMRDGTLPSVAAQRSVEPRRLGTLVRGELDWIVMKCLEKDRTRRYETASNLAADVSNYLSDAPVTAASPTAIYRLGKFARRHKVGLGVAASIFVALLVGLIVALYGLDRATRAERLAQQRLEEVSREAAKSRAVNDFLTQMLQSADPFRTERADLTVREAMENAVRTIDAGGLSSQPEIESAIRTTIGGVLQSLGRVDASVDQLRSSLDAARRRAGSADDPEVARTLNLLGMALADAGKLDEAERLTREALAMRTRLFGERSLGVAETTGNLASIRADQGDHVEAERLYRQTLDVQRALPASAFGADAESARLTRGTNLVTTMSNLARTLRLRGQLDDAERMYRDAIEQHRATLGPENPLVVLPMNNLSRLLLQHQRYADAEQLEREALAVARRALPPAHPDTLVALFGLSTALVSQMKYDDAEPLYRELIDGLRHDEAMSRAMLGDVLFGYWTILAERDRLDEAEQIARELLELRTEQSGPDSRETALAQTRLAYALAERGRNLDEAEQLMRAALAPPEKLDLPETHWVLHNQRGLLGDILLQLGKADEAAPLIRRAHAIVTADPAALPRAKRDAQDRLVRLNAKLGKAQDPAGPRAAPLAATAAATAP